MHIIFLDHAHIIITFIRFHSWNNYDKATRKLKTTQICVLSNFFFFFLNAQIGSFRSELSFAGHNEKKLY